MSVQYGLRIYEYELCVTSLRVRSKRRVKFIRDWKLSHLRKPRRVCEYTGSMCILVPTNYQRNYYWKYLNDATRRDGSGTHSICAKQPYKDTDAVYDITAVAYLYSYTRIHTYILVSYPQNIRVRHMCTRIEIRGESPPPPPRKGRKIVENAV